MKFIYIAILVAALGSSRPAFAGGVSGTFIQLNRATAEKTTGQWKEMLNRMSAAGINTLIVQWTAETPVVYFKNNGLDFKEKYDALERLFAAAEGRNFQFMLGLQNDEAFWREITAGNKVLRDYFLIRLAQNERLQKALLKSFGKRTDWVGYYIPDEIDDLSWRELTRQKILKDYLRLTIRTLRANDATRSIAISAFIRMRTAPQIAAKTLSSLTSDIGLDYLLIQDGAGLNDPPPDIIPRYYGALNAGQQWQKTRLWIVLEAFRQTSGPDERFAAEPATPERFFRQMQAASGFERLIIFSFPDYVDPDRGKAAKALYESLKP